MSQFFTGTVQGRIFKHGLNVKPAYLYCGIETQADWSIFLFLFIFLSLRILHVDIDNSCQSFLKNCSS